MARKIVGGGILLIGAYLVLTNFNGAVRDTNAGANGSIGIIKAFQGR